MSVVLLLPIIRFTELAVRLSIVNFDSFSNPFSAKPISPAILSTSPSAPVTLVIFDIFVLVIKTLFPLSFAYPIRPPTLLVPEIAPIVPIVKSDRMTAFPLPSARPIRPPTLLMPEIAPIVPTVKFNRLTSLAFVLPISPPIKLLLESPISPIDVIDKGLFILKDVDPPLSYNIPTSPPA